MKKTLSIILTLFLLFTLTGCNRTADETSSTVETVIVDETIKAHADAQAVISSGTLPELSAEDRAVKAEIAKYIDTKVDFRYNKQEKIGNMTYSISFLEVDKMSNYQDVIYQDKQNNKFRYNVNTGELTYALIESAIVEKSIDNIDKESAQNIAYSYASTKCNIDEYTVELSSENEDGYQFIYRRYMCGYKTVDVIVIKISFNGEITYILNNTHAFDNVDISKVSIDKTLVDEEINKKLGEFADKDAKLQPNTITIMTKDGKLNIAFRIAVDNSIGVFYIPIE